GVAFAPAESFDQSLVLYEALLGVVIIVAKSIVSSRAQIGGELPDLFVCTALGHEHDVATRPVIHRTESFVDAPDTLIDIVCLPAQPIVKGGELADGVGVQLAFELVGKSRQIVIFHAVAKLAELTRRLDAGIHLSRGFGPATADVVHLPSDGELIPITALTQRVDGLLEYFG